MLVSGDGDVPSSINEARARPSQSERFAKEIAGYARAGEKRGGTGADPAAKLPRRLSTVESSLISESLREAGSEVESTAREIAQFYTGGRARAADALTRRSLSTPRDETKGSAEPAEISKARPADAWLRAGEGAWPWEPGYDPATALGSRGYVRPAHKADAMINKGLDWSTASGDRGANATGVKRWREFCAAQDPPQSAERPLDPSAPLWVKLEEEWLAMQFICTLIEDRGNTPQTARAYFGHFQSWHKKEYGVKLAGNLKLERLPAMVKGLRRVLGDKPSKLRRGVAPQALRTAMDALFDKRIPKHANIRAALAFALQGLLRTAEFALDCSKKKAKKWRSQINLTRADIKKCDQKLLVVMVHPCKNVHHIGGKTVPLVIGAGGAHIDAVAEMRNLLAVDPVAVDKRGETPLFRDPDTGKSLSTEEIRSIVKACMRRVGENPDEFGGHSLRIGGATALFAAGATPLHIQTMGRWSSDLYKLYVRAEFGTLIEWTKKAGSATVSDVAGVIQYDTDGDDDDC